MAIDEVDVLSFADVHDQSTCIIDVREVDEYEAGHIRGAINIPLGDLSERFSELPQNQTIYMVCRSGSRSMRACEICIDGGITNVKNIAGGTLGWIASDYEVVNGGQPG